MLLLVRLSDLRMPLYYTVYYTTTNANVQASSEVKSAREDNSDQLNHDSFLFYCITVLLSRRRHRSC